MPKIAELDRIYWESFITTMAFDGSPHAPEIIELASSRLTKKINLLLNRCEFDDRMKVIERSLQVIEGVKDFARNQKNES